MEVSRVTLPFFLHMMIPEGKSVGAGQSVVSFLFLCESRNPLDKFRDKVCSHVILVVDVVVLYDVAGYDRKRGKQSVEYLPHFGNGKTARNGYGNAGHDLRIHRINIEADMNRGKV